MDCLHNVEHRNISVYVLAFLRPSCRTGIAEALNSWLGPKKARACAHDLEEILLIFIDIMSFYELSVDELYVVDEL